MVYSPLDALELARRNPDRQVVFFGLGFETTTPSTALSIQQAAREGLTNISVFCNHITVPEPIKAHLDDPDIVLDGFIGPGHVSMVIGSTLMTSSRRTATNRSSSPVSNPRTSCNPSSCS